MSQQVIDYDPSWPGLFEQEAERLRPLLVKWAARIEHVGSTAVPGLGAKPIIDIQIAARDGAAIEQCRIALLTLGYTEATVPVWFFHQPATWPHNYHVHVREADTYEERRLRAFRDWLRTHPHDRAAYEALKRDLARRADLRCASDRMRYSEAKTQFVREIEQRAGVPAQQPTSAGASDQRE